MTWDEGEQIKANLLHENINKLVMILALDDESY
jgi:hypothetical protein